MCENSDEAAEYQTLGPELEASYLTWHLAGLYLKLVFFLANWIFMELILLALTGLHG